MPSDILRRFQPKRPDIQQRQTRRERFYENPEQYGQLLLRSIWRPRYRAERPCERIFDYQRQNGYVMKSVKHQVQASNQVSGQVWDQVGNQVRNQVYGQVYGQVRDQVRDQVQDQANEIS